MSNYCNKKAFYAGYLAKFMFTKHCRSHKLDPTAEFFKHAGIIYNNNNEDDMIFKDDENDDGYDNDEDDGNNDNAMTVTIMKTETTTKDIKIYSVSNKRKN
jgi:hypothetical protein